MEKRWNHVKPIDALLSLLKEHRGSTGNIKTVWTHDHHPSTVQWFSWFCRLLIYQIWRTNNFICVYMCVCSLKHYEYLVSQIMQSIQIIKRISRAIFRTSSQCFCRPDLAASQNCLANVLSFSRSDTIPLVMFCCRKFSCIDHVVGGFNPSEKY